MSASTRNRDTPWAARFSEPVWNLFSGIQDQTRAGRAYLGDHNAGVSQPAVGDVNLAPVDDPVSSVLPRVSSDT